MTLKKILKNPIIYQLLSLIIITFFAIVIQFCDDRIQSYERNIDSILRSINDLQNKSIIHSIEKSKMEVWKIGAMVAEMSGGEASINFPLTTTPKNFTEEARTLMDEYKTKKIAMDEYIEGVQTQSQEKINSSENQILNLQTDLFIKLLVKPKIFKYYDCYWIKKLFFVFQLFGILILFIIQGLLFYTQFKRR